MAFDDANLTLDAAVRGRGVALTHIFHAEEHLRAGTLVRPVPMIASTTDALYLSWRTGSSEGVRRMVEWIRRELGKSVAAETGIDRRA
jgi:DNA-binding transcriptional LysR family regulator